MKIRIKIIVEAAEATRAISPEEKAAREWRRCFLRSHFRQPFASAQALPDAKAVLAKHEAAIGGRAAMEKHSSMHQTGTVSIAVMRTARGASPAPGLVPPAFVPTEPAVIGWTER